MASQLTSQAASESMPPLSGNPIRAVDEQGVVEVAAIRAGAITTVWLRESSRRQLDRSWVVACVRWSAKGCTRLCFRLSLQGGGSRRSEQVAGCRDSKPRPNATRALALSASKRVM